MMLGSLAALSAALAISQRKGSRSVLTVARGLVRDHDAHVQDWISHHRNLAYLAIVENERAEKRERDRHIIEAAEAKRARKRAKAIAREGGTNDKA
jgi:hypothetical protein